jgi:EmrB/QacA subfamily drug resistance transporter
MQPGAERRWVTAAILLGMFLAAVEATAVATAMPTAVSDLGSVERYSWAFSAYLLTSTTTVPMFGKLADLHGRRTVYLAATAIFLIGSVLCGAAANMEQLILFRALQGVGAGGVMPVAITVIGDIYSLEERGRMQGVFSGVWALASITGPAVGGLLTDALSWRWVFLINVPFGVLSAGILMIMLREETARRERRLDVAGTLALTLGVGLLLLGIQEGSAAWGWRAWPTGAALLAAGGLLALFIRQERRAVEPMLPLDLFRQPVISAASLGAVVIGTLLFPLTAFVPMFAQGVRGGTAAEAGAALMPMMIGWPIASTLAGWWLMRLGYRTLALIGAAFALGGGILLALVRADSPTLLLPAAVGMLGLGLGFVSTPLIVAVQAAVPWQRRGVATSSQQFFRTIGGALAVGILGAVLNANLAEHGIARLAQDALEPATRATLSAADVARASLGLADGLQRIFLVLALAAAATVGVALRFPKGRAEAHVYRPPAD